MNNKRRNAQTKNGEKFFMSIFFKHDIQQTHTSQEAKMKKL